MTSSGTLTKTSSQPPFSCRICGSTFVRREHLNRHLSVHSKAKPFQCRVCQKGFTRNDVLQRHERSHLADETEKSSKSGSLFRACTACAARRVRCSGGSPCGNCSKNRAGCSYPTCPRRVSSSTRSIGSNTQNDMAETCSEMKTSLGEIASNERIVPSSQSTAPMGNDPVSSDNFLPGPDMNPSMQLSAAVPDPQWDASWSTQDNPEYFRYDQSTNAGGGDPQPIVHPDLQQETPFQAQDSINWMSPSSEVWKNWDYRFTALANPGIPPATFTPLFDVSIGGSLNLGLEVGQPNMWNHNMQADLPPNFVSVGDASCTGAQSIHSVQSEAVPTPVATGSESSLRSPPRSYVESEGARGSMQRPRKRRRTNIEIDNPQGHQSNGAPLLVTSRTVLKAESSPSILWISPNLYHEMVREVELLVTEGHCQFDPRSFPSIALANEFCQLYFDHFHSEFPILQRIPFQFEDRIWILIVAIATVGAQYANSTEVTEPRTLLEQTLRNGLDTIIHAKVSPDDMPGMLPFPGSDVTESLVVVHARILNTLVMIHSGNSLMMERALADFTSLIAAASRMRLLQPVKKQVSSLSEEIQIQLRSRAGYMIWMLDFLFSFEFNQCPLLEVADAQAPLPTSQEICDGLGSPQCIKSIRNYTLTEALEILYTEKRLVENFSEFSRALLIQAICRQTMEMRRYFRNRMSSWTPSAKSQTKVHFSDPELWPPSSSSLSKWRNSACDCLDVLHWSANSKVAQSAGFEHPTVLHLHLARLIILTPHEVIREFANSYISTPGQILLDAQKNPAAYQVLQWAIRDQYKARLAIVHAASVFWHIRRYSCDTFIEPFAVFLSALAIWSFSIATRISTSSENHHRAQTNGDRPAAERTTSDDESDIDLSFINLDRPCDDESVQTFIRFGHKVTANMVRVGDICSKEAPRKILQEGILLLKGRKVARMRSGGSIKLILGTFRRGQIWWGYPSLSSSLEFALQAANIGEGDHFTCCIVPNSWSSAMMTERLSRVSTAMSEITTEPNFLGSATLL
ncbi:hypothetical protein BDZ45DRAFT_754798 [Acephala macrosclerotiorum]|nr:hypothetical protein BDZ45DRAFT_754798 [Acephala macrosclerotiorum]